MTKIRLTKISGEKSHKYSLEEGWIMDGIIEKEWMFPQEPTIGMPFVIDTYRTSQVEEILSDNTFKTYNSVYKWEKIK